MENKDTAKMTLEDYRALRALAECYPLAELVACLAMIAAEQGDPRAVRALDAAGDEIV